jgi:hypothetical protein
VTPGHRAAFSFVLATATPERGGKPFLSCLVITTAEYSFKLIFSGRGTRYRGTFFYLSLSFRAPLAKSKLTRPIRSEFFRFNHPQPNAAGSFFTAW